MSQLISVLALKYSIRFNDADDGDCYAGEGLKIISTHTSKLIAENQARLFNPLIKLAESENTVFPIQEHNKAIKKEFGFTLHDISNGYDFKLVVEELELN